MIGLLVAIAAVLVLAWQAEKVTPLEFELLLALIGIGFGPVPPMSSISLQNTVAAHHFGTAVGTMNFARTLYATILIAAFGAIVLAGVPAGAGPTALASGAADAFRYIFFASAASMMVALAGLVAMEEKPLKTNAPSAA
jgi:MFS family permease